MNDIITLEQKVALYLNYTPDNKKFYNMEYFDELGQEYGYDILYKEIKRQKKEQT